MDLEWNQFYNKGRFATQMFMCVSLDIIIIVNSTWVISSSSKLCNRFRDIEKVLSNTEAVIRRGRQPLMMTFVTRWYATSPNKESCLNKIRMAFFYTNMQAADDLCPSQPFEFIIIVCMRRKSFV